PPSSWRLLVRTWEQIGFWATSLIFLLAAMMVPDMLSSIRPYQLLELVVLVAAAFAARGFPLFALLPLLSRLRLAESVRGAYKLVILWGGMRGAVSLALALAATQNTTLAPEIHQLVGVLASSFILFTLFIGAPTLRPLMRLLKLDQLSPADIALRDRVTALELSLIGEEVATVAREHDIAGPALEEALRPYAGFSDAAAQIAEENSQLPAEPRLRAALAILIERERELYLQHFGARAMSRRALARLLSRVGMLRDQTTTGVLEEHRGAAQRRAGGHRRLLAPLPSEDGDQALARPRAAAGGRDRRPVRGAADGAACAARAAPLQQEAAAATVRRRAKQGARRRARAAPSRG